MLHDGRRFVSSGFLQSRIDVSFYKPYHRLSVFDTAEALLVTKSKYMC